MKFATITDAEQALEKYHAVTRGVTGKDSTVTRTEQLLAHIGSPHKGLRAIHIAGTSGKTSTAYYTAALLHAAGVNVGLAISPHMDSITERVQINGKPISDKKFCEYLAKFLSLIEDYAITPSWPECIMAFTFWVFAQEKPDYVVVETMLGGLHDTTNVLDRTDKLCVITDIGYDHVELLGERIEQIAYQKAGIIHDENQALLYEQAPEIMQVIRYWTTQQENAEIFPFEQWRLEKAYKGIFELSLPNFQKRNWLLAFAAYLFIARRDDLRIIADQVMQNTQTMVIPGRMDSYMVGDKKIVMDGAHNEQKMKAFVESFQAQYPDKKVPVLLALKHDKAAQGIAEIIAQVASEVIVTTFQDMPNFPIHAMPVRTVAAALRKAGVSQVRTIANAEDAFAELLAATKEGCIITGSFFLLAQIRQNHPEFT